MKLNKKILTISISAIVGVNYAYSINAKDYAPIFDETVALNEGDRIIYNDPTNTTYIRGIYLSSPTNNVTVSGAANIDITTGGGAVGAYVSNGGNLDLGSGTVMSINGTQGAVDGIQVSQSNSNVRADNLSVDVKVDNGMAGGISSSNGAYVHFTGITSLNTINNQVSGGGFAYGILMESESSLEFDKLLLNVENAEGYGINMRGGSSLALGDGSVVETKNGTALYAIGDGTTVNLNNTTLISSQGGGVSSQNNAQVNLGSGSVIDSSGTDAGILAAQGKVTGDHLNVKYNGSSYAMWANTGGSIKIGEGSHVSSASTGLIASSDSIVEFRGSATERNTLETHAQYAVSAQGLNGVINIENTDVSVDNVNGPAGSIFLGVFAVNNGITNIKDSSISIDEDGAAVYAMNAGVVNLSGRTVINAGNNLQSALATQGNNALINVTDQAIINGNIFASGAGSVIDLDTTQGAVFTGYTTIDTVAPGASINIKMADGAWNMTGNSQVNNLALNNSSINFSNAGYETLTADSLSGTNGLFNIRTDIVGQQGDLIVVNGIAEGTHKLKVTNNGSSATSGNETLTVIKADNNQANFSLANKVELGAYEYGLRPVDGSPNDLELYSSGTSGGSSLTSTAQAAGSFLNIGYLTNYIETQTLLQRLGDLRNIEAIDTKGDGLWMKGFGGKLNSFSGTALDKFSMTYTGTQLGLDKQITTESGRLLVGAMAGFTRTNPNYRQGNGNGKNYTAGIYATYLLDDGLYVDTVLKYNSMRNHFNVKDTAGQAVKGTGKTQGVSLSTEIGKRFWVSSNHQGLYFEPQAQLSYGYQTGDTVHSTNGLKVGLSHYNSTLGRVSGVVGYQIQGESPINVYLKTGIVREMSGGANYRFNDGIKNGHSFRSSWFDNGVGVNINIKKKHNLYAEADYSTGNHFDNAMLNLGYRYSF